MVWSFSSFFFPSSPSSYFSSQDLWSLFACWQSPTKKIHLNIQKSSSALTSEIFVLKPTRFSSLFRALRKQTKKWDDITKAPINMSLYEFIIKRTVSFQNLSEFTVLEISLDNRSSIFCSGKHAKQWKKVSELRVSHQTRWKKIGTKSLETIKKRR